MKRLIFVDNDGIGRANKDVKEFVIPFLVAYGGMEEKDLHIEIISDLHKQDQNELYQTFYSPLNVIISWSVYTLRPDQSNSKMQLFRFLRTANDRVENANYIDMSGEIEKTLKHALQYEDVKGVFAILTAIENNNIITRTEGGKFVRLRISFKNREVFTYDPVEMEAFLS